ncbi:MAG: hypothetical protein L7V87_10990 [Verrucomicrobiales bacterium]|nr:hypothetical protein [Verrucomicrobiales bacterium]
MKITTLLSEPEKAAEYRNRLDGEMNRFGLDVFMEELREHVLRFAGRDSELIDREASHASDPKNLAAIG